MTDKHIDIEAGPNWDDDLGGSSIYAANDPNFKALTAEEQTTSLRAGAHGLCSTCRASATIA